MEYNGPQTVRSALTAAAVVGAAAGVVMGVRYLRCVGDCLSGEGACQSLLMLPGLAFGSRRNSSDDEMFDIYSKELAYRIESAYYAARDRGGSFKLCTKEVSLPDPSHLSVPLVFQAQVAQNLKDKPVGGRSSDPFSPPFEIEELLIDEDLTTTHRLMLNRFYVVPFHVLVCTKKFEEQHEKLTKADVKSADKVLRAYAPPYGCGAMAFVNHGPQSGFSQPHKHIQVVPLPLALTCREIPIEQLLRRDRLIRIDSAEALNSPMPLYYMDVPYNCVVALNQSFPSPPPSPRLPQRKSGLLHPLLSGEDAEDNACSLPVTSGFVTAEILDSMVKALGLDWSPEKSFNLLWTHRWAIAVARRKECFHVDDFSQASVNALGFTGSFFVPSDSVLKGIERKGPLSVLSEVAVRRQRLH